jgi:hypothetical protein
MGNKLCLHKLLAVRRAAQRQFSYQKYLHGVFAKSRLVKTTSSSQVTVVTEVTNKVREWNRGSCIPSLRNRDYKGSCFIILNIVISEYLFFCPSM